MKEFENVGRLAIEIFDDVPCYDEAQVVDLAQLQDGYAFCDDAEARARIRAEFAEKLGGVRRRENAPGRVYLLPETKMPCVTEYTVNPDNRFNHGPEFRPYFLEMSHDAQGRGGVHSRWRSGLLHCIRGVSGVQGMEQTWLSGFLLQNRVNHNTWSEQESGVNVPRCLRIIRKNTSKYRIDPANVAAAGFSSGGLTGDNCIRYFSGEQTVADHFPGYEADELDAYYGVPDAFLCIYDPRFKGSRYDFTNVKYPPTFFAVGRDDFAMDNLNYVYPMLVQN